MWQPLPPRKKNRRIADDSAHHAIITTATEDLRSAGDSSNNVNNNQGSSSSESQRPRVPSGTDSASSRQGFSYNGIDDDNHVQLNHDQVTRNVQSRMKLVRAKATLESQDGCAGEFYEYLDHTADVQFHVWGDSLQSAFENIAPCFVNYITDLSTVDIDMDHPVEFEASGHDMHSLLFAYMDEMLFRFCSDGFVCAKVEIVSFDKESFKLSLKGFGESFDQAKHPQGTEIKAITYSNMQIHETDTRSDIYVIVDI